MQYLVLRGQVEVRDGDAEAEEVVGGRMAVGHLVLPEGKLVAATSKREVGTDSHKECVGGVLRRVGGWTTKIARSSCIAYYLKVVIS